MHRPITWHIKGGGWVNYVKSDTLQKTGSHNPQTGTLNPKQESTPGFYRPSKILTFHNMTT